jgi:endonuclease/exonuclease/phosphatase family metal-dependent hydrolase
LYNYGLTKYDHPRLYQNEKILAMRKFVAENDFDILCCQENNNNISMDDIAVYVRPLFEEGFLFFEHGDYSLTIASKHPIFNFRSLVFENKVGTNTRGFLKAEMCINNHKTLIIDAHPTPEDTAEGAEVRQLQYDEILDIADGYDYAILFGDWNCRSVEELSIFQNRGFLFANGGYLPYEPTASAMNPTQYLDNIFVKGLRGVRLFGHVGDPVKIESPTESEDERDLYVSDHMPLIAKLQIS